MRFTIPWICIALLTILLTGCRLELPKLLSASVVRYAEGRAVATCTLTPGQAALVHAWFVRHQTAWSPTLATYVPKLLIQTTHTGGQRSSINIWASGFVVVNVASGQFEQQFDAATFKELLAIIETAPATQTQNASEVAEPNSYASCTTAFF